MKLVASLVEPGRVGIGAAVTLGRGRRGEILTYRAWGVPGQEFYDCLVKTPTGELLSVTLQAHATLLKADPAETIARAVLAGRPVELAPEQQLRVLAGAYLRALNVNRSTPHASPLPAVKAVL